MDERPPPERPYREPIRSPWVWVVMGVIVLAGVPFYFPQGTVRPLLFGLPYWMVVSVVVAVLFSGYISWLCLNWWNIAEPEERRTGTVEPGEDADTTTAPRARDDQDGATWTT